MDQLLFYIDDDSDDLGIFLYAANSLGVKVRLFANGEHFLNQLELSDEKPSAIFVDINMPRMNGFEVLKKIADIPALKSIPMIAFSTAGDLTSTKLAENAGATCYISKPASIAQLKKILNMVISTDWSKFDGDLNFYLKKI